jgi:cellulose synthase/poly-beta-1,6-N-acetylglucosamine synthase-like glycosyltransferase
MLPVLERFLYFVILFVGSIATVAGVYSLFLGKTYDRRVSETIGRRKNKFQPHVCLIMPCKGNEPQLEENIASLLRLDYPNYHVLVVTDTETDPAHEIAESIIRKANASNARLITAIPSRTASGKVTALLTALESARGQAEVYAFVDSDASICSSWLSELVDPLVDTTIGATTGFRWYLAQGFWSQVQSAWNASGSNLMFDGKYNFPWGGAMALRAETLDRIHIREVWRDAISDDLTLNLALRTHGYHTIFLPQCTVVTITKNMTCSRFLTWATNQTALTRTYHRKLWNYALAVYTFFNATFILGIYALSLGFLNNPDWYIPATLLLLPLPIGILRSQMRCETYQHTLPSTYVQFKKSCRRGSFASLIVPWIMTYCIIKSIYTREIEWRGRKYNLRPVKIATP